MVLTGTRAREAFDHVVKTVFPANITPESPLILALADMGINDIISMCLIPANDIADMEYTDAADSTTKKVPYYQRQVLSIFLLYLQHRDSNGDSIADDEWTRLTASDFDAFRTSPIGRAYGRGTATAMTSAPSPTAGQGP